MSALTALSWPRQPQLHGRKRTVACGVFRKGVTPPSVTASRSSASRSRVSAAAPMTIRLEGHRRDMGAKRKWGYGGGLGREQEVLLAPAPTSQGASMTSIWGRRPPMTMPASAGVRQHYGQRMARIQCRMRSRGHSDGCNRRTKHSAARIPARHKWQAGQRQALERGVHPLILCASLIQVQGRCCIFVIAPQCEPQQHRERQWQRAGEREGHRATLRGHCDQRLWW